MARTLVGWQDAHYLLNTTTNRPLVNAAMDVQDLATGAPVTDLQPPTGYTGQPFPAGQARSDGDGFYGFTVADGQGPVRVRVAEDPSRNLAAGQWLTPVGQALANGPLLGRGEASNTYARLGQGDVPRFARQQPQVQTNFAAGHGWAVVSAGGGTSNLNDTSDFAFGTQCVRLTTGGTGASMILGKSGVASIPADRMFRLWVKVTAPETLAQVRIFASTDSGFANYYSLASAFSSASIPEAQRPFKAGEWVPIAFPWSIATSVGAPNRADLTHLRILVNDRNGVAATVRLGRLEWMPYPADVFSSGVVSMTYDDSFASHYTVARAHLDKFGYAGTLFPILDRLDQPGYLTTAQVDELAYTSGWEIGAHASTYDRHTAGVDGLSNADRLDEFGTLRAWQQGRGFTSPSFAYPNGTVDVPSTVDLRSYYAMGRLALGRLSASGADELQNPNLPLRLYAQNPTSLTLAQMTAEVDRAVANKTWLIFVFHDLVAAKGAANDVAIADHAALVDYLSTSGVAVRTMGEVRAASA